MDFSDHWSIEYHQELEHAVIARSLGNEGQSRVCARRAAGILVGEYLNRLGYTGLTHSVYERLRLFSSLPEVNLQCREIATHFLWKVNRERMLPGDVDLIQDVLFLEKTIMGNPSH